MGLGEKVRKLFGCTPQRNKQNANGGAASQAKPTASCEGPQKQVNRGPQKMVNLRTPQKVLDAKDARLVVTPMTTSLTGDNCSDGASGAFTSTPQSSSPRKNGGNSFTVDSDLHAAGGSFYSGGYTIDIFHDAENCPVRMSTNGSRLYDLVVTNILKAIGVDTDNIDVDAYCNVNWRFVLPFVCNRHFPSRTLRDLLTRGVTHLNPGDKVGAVNTVIKESLERLKFEHFDDGSVKKGKRIIVLMSCNRDFASSVRGMKQCGFNLMLVYSPLTTCPGFVDLFRNGHAFGVWDELLEQSELTRKELNLFEKRLSFRLGGQPGAAGGAGAAAAHHHRARQRSSSSVAAASAKAAAGDIIETDCLEALLSIPRVKTDGPSSSGSGSGKSRDSTDTGCDSDLFYDGGTARGGGGGGVGGGSMWGGGDGSLAGDVHAQLNRPNFKFQCASDLYEFLLIQPEYSLSSDSLSEFWDHYPQHRHEIGKISTFVHCAKAEGAFSWETEPRKGLGHSHSHSSSSSTTSTSPRQHVLRLRVDSDGHCIPYREYEQSSASTSTATAEGASTAGASASTVGAGAAGWSVRSLSGDISATGSAGDDDGRRNVQSLSGKEAAGGSVPSNKQPRSSRSGADQEDSCFPFSSSSSSSSAKNGAVRRSVSVASDTQSVGSSTSAPRSVSRGRAGSRGSQGSGLDADKFRATFQKPVIVPAPAKLSDIPKAVLAFFQGICNAVVTTTMTAHDRNCEGIVDYVEGRIATLRHLKVQDCIVYTQQYTRQCTGDVCSLLRVTVGWYLRLSLQDKCESIVWLALVLVSLRVVVNVLFVTTW